MAQEMLGCGDGGLDRVDGVPRARGAGHRRREAELGRVVDHGRQPPRAAAGGLELGEVGLPDAVAPHGRLERNVSRRAAASSRRSRW